MASLSPARGSALFQLSGNLFPQQLTLRYRTALTLVAGAMLVLPVLYAGLIVAAVWLVWWHATTNISLITQHLSQASLFAYVAPLFAGAVMVFFMVKPIIARPAARHDATLLSRTEEPELFELIEAVCSKVGAPAPGQVAVDCRINASAGFAPGLDALVRKELVLTIGLPLVAAMSVREFAGVLAHEFGHFSQSGAMRLTTLVRGINHWFARVVYERDRWDEKLEEWSRTGVRTGIVVMLAQGAVWTSRFILTQLMRVGHGVSCFLLRQMEYDADAYEIQLAGTHTFLRTAARIRELNAAAHLAYRDLHSAFQTHSAPMDLPGFILEHYGTIPHADREALRRVPDARTGLWHTHPSDADRARAAQRLGAAGILVGGEESATALFSDFGALSVAATRTHYVQDLQLDVDAVVLVDATVANQERQRREADPIALQAFFGKCISVWRPLTVSVADVENLTDAELHAAIASTRTAMAESQEVAKGHYQALESHTERRVKAIAAEEFLLSGGTMQDPRGISEFAEPDIASAQQAQARALSALHEHRVPLEHFEALVCRRLACGAVLTDRANGTSDLSATAATFNAVSAHLPTALEAHQHLTVINLLANAPASANAPTFGFRVNVLAARFSNGLLSIARALAAIPCPESVCKQPISLAAWCGLSTEHSNPPAVLDQFVGAYFTLLGRLTAATLAVEDAAATAVN